MPDELQIKFFQIDPAAKSDTADISASAHSPWSAVDDLRFDNLPRPGIYATNEPNYIILDGSMSEFPDETEGMTWGYWSDSLSDGDGGFAFPPTLNLSFSLPHKSKGLTLHYYNDCGYTVRVTWYSDTAGTIPIASGEYDSKAITETVSEWRHIKIEFLKTSIPYRYVKLWAIDYGIIRMIENDEISGCRILEAIDPTVESISVNTLDASIRTRQSIFSPITSPDFDDLMMQYQPLTVTRNGVLFGTFFLESWTDVYQSGVEFDIQAIDAIGIFDLYQFTGDVYVNKPIRELLDEIFEIAFPTGLITYQLDPNFENEVINGWIPFGTCGLAFQHICFALNATADTSRTDYVWIYPREVDIKPDSAPESADKQPFINIDDLKSPSPAFYYATNEPNYATLDGLANELPGDTSTLNLGWCSQSMSDKNGLFANPPILNITFGTNHILEAMTFDFGPYEAEYIKTANITFYDEFDNIVLRTGHTFTGNKDVFVRSVYWYRRVEIEVIETSQPFRFAKIFSIDYGKSFHIPLNEQYRSGRDEPAEFVSGVVVVSHDFAAGDERVEAQKGTLPLGENIIRFSEPLHSLEITGGIIISGDANHVAIDVSTADEVVLTGKKYIDNQRLHIISAGAEAGRIENILPYESYTLVSLDRGGDLAQKLYDYLRQPIVTTVDIRLNNRETGYIARLDTRRRAVTGVITSMDINLRANKASIEVRGNVDRTDF